MRGSSADSELLAATRTDPRAFGELYARCERGMLGFFLRATGSAELAADLTAETFAQALESAESFDPLRGEARAWLYGIARHVLAHSLERGQVEDRARRRLGMRPLLLDDEAFERIESVASLDGDALAMLAELPVEIRRAVSGRVLEERSYEELAAALECSPALVRKRVSRGLGRLRKRMEGKS